MCQPWRRIALCGRSTVGRPTDRSVPVASEVQSWPISAEKVRTESLWLAFAMRGANTRKSLKTRDQEEAEGAMCLIRATLYKLHTGQLTI